MKKKLSVRPAGHETGGREGKKMNLLGGDRSEKKRGNVSRAEVLFEDTQPARRAVFVLPFPFPPSFFLSFRSFSFFSFISPPLLLRCNLAATRRLQLPTAVACLTSSPLRFLAFSLGLSALLRDVYFSTLVRDRSFRRRVTRVARNFNTLEGSERASRQAG